MRCHEHEALGAGLRGADAAGPARRGGAAPRARGAGEGGGLPLRAGPGRQDDGRGRGGAGALPLLAFAVSRLWEKRDRERKLLTQEAYAEIGGVAGALARHAEATLERIGAERQGMVREVFRNLVTAQGTRAACDREELLSVFPDRRAAEEVLGQLVAARLLTSWEMPIADGAGEGVSNRPRPRPPPDRDRPRVAAPVVATAGALAGPGRGGFAAARPAQAGRAPLGREGALDGPPVVGDVVPRVRAVARALPGPLTALEEAYARAMTDRALRRRRLRRAAVVAALVGVSAVAIVVSVSRQQATKARDQARAEALRAEASRLVTLGQLRLADDPTEALAFATASLELADTPEARVFVMKALWEAPPSFTLPVGPPSQREPAFSPDGTKLAAGDHDPVELLWNESGGAPMSLEGDRDQPTWLERGWLVGRRPPRDRPLLRLSRRGCTSGRPTGNGCERSSSAPQPGGRSERSTSSAGRTKASRGAVRCCCAPGGSGWPAERPRPRPEECPLGLPPRVPSCRTRRAWRMPVTARSSCVLCPRARAQETDSSGVTAPTSSSSGQTRGRWDRLLSRDKSGEARIWTLAPGRLDLERVIPRPATAPPAVFGGEQRWVHGSGWDDKKVRLWDLEALPGSRPLELRRSGSWYLAWAPPAPEGRLAHRVPDRRSCARPSGRSGSATRVSSTGTRRSPGRSPSARTGDGSRRAGPIPGFGSGPCPVPARASRGYWSFPRRRSGRASCSIRAAGTCSRSARDRAGSCHSTARVRGGCRSTPRTRCSSRRRSRRADDGSRRPGATAWVRRR